ncbi:MAG: hypothetical protein COX19_01225 [Desulfobacterales bacterium CG23_combo_of_CG06-09_8_20_14_all_51_8]|nr:MAG: hypothetical protein COX19_01225 [Desulfobacterales bacterium CG23_combo_of_CG06-09_8_20_14_all_51_8]
MPAQGKKGLETLSNPLLLPAPCPTQSSIFIKFHPKLKRFIHFTGAFALCGKYRHQANCF